MIIARSVDGDANDRLLNSAARSVDSADASIASNSNKRFFTRPVNTNTEYLSTSKENQRNTINQSSSYFDDTLTVANRICITNTYLCT